MIKQNKGQKITDLTYAFCKMQFVFVCKQSEELLKTVLHFTESSAEGFEIPSFLGIRNCILHNVPCFCGNGLHFAFGSNLEFRSIWNGF